MVNIYQVSDTRWSNALTTYNAIWMDVNNGAGGAAVGAAASRLLKLTNNSTEVFGVNLNGSMQITSPSLTASDPHNIAQTWNAGGVTFTGWKLDVTDTASASASLLMDLKVGGATKLKVRKDGTLIGDATGGATLSLTDAAGSILKYGNWDFVVPGSTMYFRQTGTAGVALNVATGAITLGVSGSQATLVPAAANTLAQRNSTNAQNIRIYNTYTDSSNGAWAFINAAQTGGTESGAANTLTFGSIGNGSGAGQLTKFKLVVDGTSRLDYNITSTSHWTTSSSFRTQGSLYADSYLILSNSQYVWLSAPASGVMLMHDAAGTDFSRIQFGGTNTSFPALKRSGAGLSYVLADGTLPTTFTPITTGVLQISGTSTTDFGGLRFTAATFASLPTAASAGAGARFYITDGTTSTFYATVSGTGANAVCVFSDGTQYRVG